MINKEKFQIKLAGESDVKSIINIVSRSFVQYCKAIGINTIEALEESEQNVLDDIAHKYVYLAYWEDKPVGSIRIEIKERKATISRFAILPEYQALGIGSEILAFAEKSLDPLKIESVELYSAVDNIRLKDFYIHKGYSIISIDDSKGYRKGLFQKKIQK